MGIEQEQFLAENELLEWLTSQGIRLTRDEMLSMTELDLSYYMITTLPESVSVLRSLKSLDLAGTKLESLPENIGLMSALEVLDLRLTGISELPDSICNLLEMRKLNLSRSALMKLPDGMGRLTNLIELDLSETALSVLPESIGALLSLKQLDISRTNINELPESICDLTCMETFDISGTGITELPVNLHNLTSLKNFWYYDTDITARSVAEPSLDQIEAPEVVPIEEDKENDQLLLQLNSLDLELTMEEMLPKTRLKDWLIYTMVFISSNFGLWIYYTWEHLYLSPYMGSYVAWKIFACLIFLAPLIGTAILHVPKKEEIIELNRNMATTPVPMEWGMDIVLIAMGIFGSILISANTYFRPVQVGFAWAVMSNIWVCTAFLLVGTMPAPANKGTSSTAYRFFQWCGYHVYTLNRRNILLTKRRFSSLTQRITLNVRRINSWIVIDQTEPVASPSVFKTSSSQRGLLEWVTNTGGYEWRNGDLSVDIRQMYTDTHMKIIGMRNGKQVSETLTYWRPVDTVRWYVTEEFLNDILDWCVLRDAYDTIE